MCCIALPGFPTDLNILLNSELELLPSSGMTFTLPSVTQSGVRNSQGLLIV
jgi:hypothetical protein